MLSNWVWKRCRDEALPNYMWPLLSCIIPNLFAYLLACLPSLTLTFTLTLTHQPDNYEAQLVESHKAKAGYTPARIELEFLQVAKDLPCYGMCLFAAQVSNWITRSDRGERLHSPVVLARTQCHRCMSVQVTIFIDPLLCIKWKTLQFVFVIVSQ